MLERVGRLVFCPLCNLPKKPHGRDVPAIAGRSHCDGDCPGYFEEPKPGCLWPGERESDYGYETCGNAVDLIDHGQAVRRQVDRLRLALGECADALYDESPENPMADAAYRLLNERKK